jgi:hypothetical protein
MYKAFKKGKFRIAFDKFRKTAKNISPVYKTGIRNWTADDSYNYSLVFGTFRIIFSVDRPCTDQCPG